MSEGVVGPPTAVEIEARLTGQMDYTEAQAIEVAARLLNLSPELGKAFALWWQTSELPEISREGFSATELQVQFGMNPIGTLLTLEDLEADPGVYVSLLRRGLDEIRSLASDSATRRSDS